MNPADQPIPGMDDKYSAGNKPPISKIPDKAMEEFEKTKAKLEKVKAFILKKFPYTEAIGILPPQSARIFIEEEEIPKETEKFTQLFMIIPEEKLKETPKIKKEIVKELEKSKDKVWIQIRTPVDVWEYCLDSKFDVVSSIALSVPLYDKGILGALRVAEIHKSLVLRKFDKYVVSYVLGGSLVTGTATKTSDIDVFVIINDTDVKRMPRLELKERLRQQIYKFVAEAESLAGAKNRLEPQIYLLTDFWESVKDAHPVMFTFIRDGVPLYDRGTFMPWKTLLKMGKLKPSPESIDMFMSMGDKTEARVKRGMLDSLTDIFWSVTTPAQALLMLAGLPPPNAKKELIPELKREFLNKKMIEKKYIDFLEKVVGLWRDYEHGKIKEISGKEIDQLMKDTDDYLKRLKALRVQIEKKSTEKTIEQIYEDAFELLKAIFGKKAQAALIADFEKELVKKGKMSQNHLKILNNIVGARTEFKKGKSNSHKIENARRDAAVLINALIEYNQRCDLVALERARMRIKFKEDGKEKIADLVMASGQAFLINGLDIKKITSKVEESNVQEFNNAVSQQKDNKEISIDPKIFELLEKELGKFEIAL